MRKHQIVVIGDSEEIDINNRLAYETGKVIAENGWVLVTGGRSGVMQNASKGAKDNGGMVVGVTPDEEMSSGNPYIDIIIPTGIGYARNSINVLCGDAVVVIGGMAGTFSEIGYAWCYEKPVLAFANSIGWGGKLAGQKIDNRRSDNIISVTNAGELEKELKKIFNNK